MYYLCWLLLSFSFFSPGKGGNRRGGWQRQAPTAEVVSWVHFRLAAWVSGAEGPEAGVATRIFWKTHFSGLLWKAMFFSRCFDTIEVAFVAHNSDGWR
jgi:hypothetical protein